MSNQSSNSKCSRTFYEKKWSTVIDNQLSDLEGNGIVRTTSAKEDIWTAYCAFNQHCTVNYLRSPQARMDRHKVAACYLCAVLVARPLIIKDDACKETERRLSNEYLAVSVAISILASFTLTAIDRASLTDSQKEIAKQSVENGLDYAVRFPGGHEPYLTSVVKCLRFTEVERRYNILMASLLMYHWESALIGDQELFSQIIKSRGAVLE